MDQLFFVKKLLIILFLIDHICIFAGFLRSGQCKLGKLQDILTASVLYC